MFPWGADKRRPKVSGPTPNLRHYLKHRFFHYPSQEVAAPPSSQSRHHLPQPLYHTTCNFPTFMSPEITSTITPSASPITYHRHPSRDHHAFTPSTFTPQVGPIHYPLFTTLQVVITSVSPSPMIVKIVCNWFLLISRNSYAPDSLLGQHGVELDRESEKHWVTNARNYVFTQLAHLNVWDRRTSECDCKTKTKSEASVANVGPTI